jgi:hypothetical protein
MNNDKLIYLATPYSHENKKVKQERFDKVNRYAAELMNAGKFVFSPISHAHVIAIDHDLPGDWEYWEHHCRLMLRNCSKVIVYCQDGWKESVGIKHEVELATSLGIQVEYKKASEDDSDDICINITAKMKRRWVPYFLGLLQKMNYNGLIGQSSKLVFNSDGGGDFRPEFDWDGDHSTIISCVKDKHGNDYFDAG